MPGQLEFAVFAELPGKLEFAEFDELSSLVRKTDRSELHRALIIYIYIYTQPIVTVTIGSANIVNLNLQP